MQSLHGFNLIREESLQEVGGTVKLFKHIKTGAELLSISNKDTNKCFGVSFRTPPKNSTGVAHILEHSVLCGSEKFPTKEPFVELLKSSLQTFLNAMTYPDKTCYPVASTNTQDLYNLMDVYMDAVFFPRVRTEEGKDILAQEGWHIDTSGEKWQFKGVVYNEMKGVYSSPDSVLAEQSQQSIFPDNIYSLDSGGNPQNILELSFEEFEDFHKKYYHPSNAYFFFNGDDPEEKRLEKVNEVISKFGKIGVNSSISLQKNINQARKIEVPFEINEEDNADGNAPRGHATVNWLLCETYEVEKNLLFHMLDHILTELPGSPLRKALIDSGLGEDITGNLESDLMQMFYSIGLRSLEPNKEDEMEALILDTLLDLVENGIPERAIEAAINATEFHLREGNTGRYPKGLVYMTNCLTHWLYGQDVFNALAWEKPLANIKASLAKKERIFENLIKEYFIDNNHRTLVNLVPDKEIGNQRLAEEQASLDAMISKMSDEEKAKIDAESKRLQIAQEKEDSPEALATIPILTINDIPKENEILPIEIKNEKIKIFRHELETFGIIYPRFVFSLDAVPYELLPYLSLYSRALTEVGTKNYDFIELGLEIEASTGGISGYSSMRSKINSEELLNNFVISGKSTEDKIEKLVNLFEEIIFNPNFDNKERFVQMVLEEKARIEQAMIPAGHSFVLTRLGGMQSKLGAINEYSAGVNYLNFVRNLSKTIESDWQEVLDKLNSLHKLIFNKTDLLLSLTANSALLAKAEKTFAPFIDKLSNLPQIAKKEEWKSEIISKNEALLVPARVNYVGMGTNLHIDGGYTFNASSLVITRFLRMGYLWDRIRVLGGAYGCFVQYSRLTGAFSFVSYRDPQVEKSLEVYRKTPDFLGNLHLSERDLSCAIIATIGDIDGYQVASAKGASAMWNKLTNNTDKLRQQIRDEVLSTKLSDFQDFAKPLEKALSKAHSVALGGNAVEDYAKSNNWDLTKLM